ncbi:MAG: STAS domain-containing protein [Solirubrobacterales bacterium]
MDPEPLLTTRIEKSNGVARLLLHGELDMWTAPLLTEPLTALERDGVDEVVLELRDLTFMDVAGLHAFVDARQRAEMNGHRLLVAGARPFARRLFQLTGTEYLLAARDVLAAAPMDDADAGARP